ncbi:PREDICTED: hsp70-Hsp90 organizing protein 3-like [Acropora digitifera]|uniref:hsp70-Hsp90 organizing protein 3-like n=1 Tax=Acropora digitifera TaxID=70779 RepID=UPI00077A0BDE|nr:PREDICTED: hsp70-Hsp90 organizing protein 3-like [Acropora digitifera]
MADAVKAAELKNKGNSFLQTGDYAKAIECYTEAIALNPLEHVFYSNRSAAYAKDKNYEKALADARKCVELKPDWGKGYSRLGAALSFLGRHAEAERAYTKGLQLDPTNEQLKSGLEEAKAQAARNSPTTNPLALRFFLLVFLFAQNFPTRATAYDFPRFVSAACFLSVRYFPVLCTSFTRFHPS